MGISSTLYFRSMKEVFKAGIMQEIEKMGHEAGYHYQLTSIELHISQTLEE